MTHHCTLPPKPFPFALLLTVATIALPFTGATVSEASAQPPAEAPSTQTPNNWQVSIRSRIGFYVPRWDYERDQQLPRRPTFGVEFLVRHASSPYGARVLYDRSRSWDQATIPGFDPVAGGPYPERFTSLIADFIFYPVRSHAFTPYLFGGAGMKTINMNGDFAISPYSLVGNEQTGAWHGGAGLEVAVEGLQFIFEVGDYYGGDGGLAGTATETPPTDPVQLGKVHDLHITTMIRVSDLGRYIN